MIQVPIDAHTALFGVIGDPIRHSMSPAIHNAACQALGINAAYLAFEVGDVEGACRAVKALGMLGLSVTIPHKVEVMKYLDEIDPLAAHTGSVNTVVNRDGRLYGCSSDGYGALKAFAEQGVSTEGKTVILFGAGGAARAVGFALAGAEGKAAAVHIAALQYELESLETLAREIAEATGARTTATVLEDRFTLQKLVAKSDLLVNCTPVGMHPKTEASVIPANWHRAEMAVFDAVYNPVRTTLLQDAEAAGAKTIEGLAMFIHQAAVQFELFTGKEPPLDIMAQAVRHQLGVS